MRLYFTVPEDRQTQNGVLLRSFLRRCAVSTELARGVKFRGSGFFADGQPVQANRRVYPGQVVSFELPPEQEGVAPQPEIPVQVVYQDAFAVVLEKPPHLAVHPTLNYPYDTLANGYGAWAAQQGHSPVFRPVNRIDKDTSGLVLAAKNTYAAPLLAQNVEKLYYAVVEGELPLGKGVIDAPIGRQADSIIGRCVTPEGKPSRTGHRAHPPDPGALCFHRAPAGRRRPVRRQPAAHRTTGTPLRKAGIPGTGLHPLPRRHRCCGAGGPVSQLCCYGGKPPAAGHRRPVFVMLVKSQ